MTACSLLSCSSKHPEGNVTDASAASATGTGGAGGAGGAELTSSGNGGESASQGSGGPSTALFPLVDGMVWSYKVTKVGNGGPCSEGSFTASLAATSDVDGKHAFKLPSWCDALTEPDTFAAGVGDEVFQRLHGSWEPLLDGVIEDGHTWLLDGVEYRWKSLGTQTVKGQKHKDCWGAQRNDLTLNYDIYCRGIGPLKHHRQTGADGNDAVLD